MVVEEEEEEVSAVKPVSAQRHQHSEKLSSGRRSVRPIHDQNCEVRRRRTNTAIVVRAKTAERIA